MSQGPMHPRIAYLLSLTTESDVVLARALGISQPTMWRLRNGRIKGGFKYADRLERHLAAQLPEDAENIFAELRVLAGRSPVLLDLLRNLIAAIRFHSGSSESVER